MNRHALIRLCLAAVLAAGAVLAHRDAAAGTLEPSQRKGCDHDFSGPIESGDYDRIKDLGGGPDQWPTICLDSPGGKLTEATRMFRHIWAENIATAVMPGDSCLSACAIVFLGGSYSTGSDVTYQFDRTLYPGGRLGFHSPSLELPPGGSYSSEEVNTAFEGALLAARLIYEINQTVDRGNRAMSDHLYYQILATPPKQMKFIETVADAVLSDIFLAEPSVENFSYVDPQTLTDADMINVCRNYLVSTELKESFLKPTIIAEESYARLDPGSEDDPVAPRVVHANIEDTERFVVGPFAAATKYFDYHCAISYWEDEVFDQDGNAGKESSFSVSLLESQTFPDIHAMSGEQWEARQSRRVEPYYRLDPKTPISGVAAAITAGRAASSVPLRFRTLKNRDIRGLDIASRKGIGAEGCQIFCTRTPGCDTAVHDRWNDFCFAKRYDGMAAATFSARSDVLTRVARSIPDAANQASLAFGRRAGRAFVGESYETFDDVSQGDCESFCREDARCAGYNSAGRSCRLFETTRTHNRAGKGSGIGYKYAPQ